MRNRETARLSVTAPLILAAIATLFGAGYLHKGNNLVGYFFLLLAVYQLAHAGCGYYNSPRDEGDDTEHAPRLA